MKQQAGGTDRAGRTVGPDPSFFTEQAWDEYSAEDHEVWSLLFERRMRTLEGTASRIFLEGAEAIGLRPDQVPDLSDVNDRLAARTGWQSIPVTGFLPAADFFVCLARRWFPTTITVRSKQQLDYTPQPDIFHDVFGHVPLHADPVFADFLQGFGEAATRARSDEEVEMMGRLFWFTVEFGLIRERGELRVYGNGLISSAGDADNALSPACDRRPFSLDAVVRQPVDPHRLQDVLFAIESFDELFEAVGEAKRRLG